MSVFKCVRQMWKKFKFDGKTKGKCLIAFVDADTHTHTNGKREKVRRERERKKDEDCDKNWIKFCYGDIYKIYSRLRKLLVCFAHSHPHTN